MRVRFSTVLPVRLALFSVLAAAFLCAVPARAKTRPVVVGYFPQWGVHNAQPYYVRTLIDNGSARKLSQINYANGSVKGGRCAVSEAAVDLHFTFRADQSVNGRADDPRSAFRGNFHQLAELKRRYPRLKILMSLEGKPEDFAEGAKPENRRAFVASCVDTFIRGQFAAGLVKPGIFDGFDLDWESPEARDAANFEAMLKEFRRQMDAVRPGLRLSVAVGDSPQMLPGTDFRTIASIVDQVGMMNYDYVGPWNGRTGFVAPLFANPAAPHDYSSIERSIAAYEAAGVPARKLLMGMPFYGYSWTHVEEANNGLFQEGDGVREDAPVHAIRSLVEPFHAFRDPRSRAPWLFDGDTFWTYEDAVSTRYKVSYAVRQHLGGVMIWELSGDTPDAELLHATFQALRHPLRNREFPEPALAMEESPSGNPVPHLTSE
jgi:chitinase